MMHAPSFWHKPHPLAYFLFPVSCLYTFAGKLRTALTTAQVFPMPVICVGNAVSGGAGKTPTVIAVAGLLHEQGKNVHVVSRGYGGSAEGPLRVDVSRHRAEDVGDEPLLIAATVPCWVAKRRKEGVQAAIEAGANVVVLDDGLQNPSIQKTFSLLVVDGGYGAGNGMVMPAGPLRESLSSALRKANAVVMIGQDQTHLEQSFGKMPLLRASIVPANPKTLYDKRFIAFAGIGRPEKFFATIREYGGIVEEGISFPDHHTYTETDLEMLAAKAKKYQIELITTEKDHVRLPAFWRERITSLPVSLQFRQPDVLGKMIASVFSGDAVRAG